MSDSMLDVLYGVLMFAMGAWHGWVWREIIDVRRRRAIRHSDGRDGQ